MNYMTIMELIGAFPVAWPCPTNEPGGRRCPQGLVFEVDAYDPSGQTEGLPRIPTTRYRCQDCDFKVEVTVQLLDMTPDELAHQIRRQVIHQLADRLAARFPGTEDQAWKRDAIVDAIRKIADERC